MTFSTPEPVISGLAYPVQDVNGHPCASYDDFVGEAQFTIDVHGPYTVSGSGFVDGDYLKFYEKDHDGTGKDIRVWQVVRSASGGFTAEHGAAS